jgi:PBP1b-binding outer membrane lipoprotein LpoB
MKPCGYIGIMLVAILVVSCSSATPAPLPTYTPQPTYTPYPTFTPPAQSISAPVAATMVRVTQAPSSAASAQASCIDWKDASTNVNRTTCVRGVVANTSLSGTTFFIDFDNTRASFYAVSFTYTWENLRGKCVEISGRISLYSGRPQIIIDKQDQLKFCAS